MVDAEAYATHNPSSILNEPYVFPEYFITTRDLSEEQLIVCAYWINGFSFLSKTWGRFVVENLSGIVWDEEAFKKLVMKEERRRLIHGLVKAHRQDQSSFGDIVQDKGRGLVCLLAGSPGIGKTLTAEVVEQGRTGYRRGCRRQKIRDYTGDYSAMGLRASHRRI